MNIEAMLAILAAAIALISALIKYRSGRENTSSTLLSPERLAELHTSLPDPEAVRGQLQRGNKITAIKLYREQTGLGLRESKAAIEAMQAEMRTFPATSISESKNAMDVVDSFLRAGKKLQAIKVYRQQTGTGLKEAKAAVEHRMITLTPTIDGPVPEHGMIDPDELHRLIQAKQKIRAIKYYRETTGVGLKEAKEAVDWLEVQHR